MRDVVAAGSAVFLELAFLTENVYSGVVVVIVCLLLLLLCVCVCVGIGVWVRVNMGVCEYGCV